MSEPGGWPSPITAAMAASAGLRIADLQVAGDAVYWVEGRAAEGGRSVIVRHREGDTVDLLPAPWSARTSVHEYGGGAYTVHDNVVYFSNANDNRLMRLAATESEPSTVCDTPGLRFADFVVDSRRSRLISVVEDHRHSSRVDNFVAAIPIDGGEIDILTRGADFYAAPRLSPDGHHLAWLSWDLPDMPWDASALSVAHVDNRSGSLAQSKVIAGGGGRQESVLSPSWSPDGRLHFIFDRAGWWNLHVAEAATVRCVAPMEAECGVPAWVFGRQPYAFLDRGRAVLAGSRDGVWRLFVVDLVDGGVRELDLPFTEIGVHVGALDGAVITLAGGPRSALAVVRVDPDTGDHVSLRSSLTLELDAGSLSAGEPITYTSDGVTAHAFLYPPHRASQGLDPNQRPPLIVRAHGGPTSQTSTSLDVAIQYYTSRGFAYCDVDYRGSTGYGRDYRQALRGRYGVADVADCLAAARHLAETGVVDPARMFIRGGSAGGHITLLALCGHDVFAGGSSLFGIADLLLLAAETHKFESRYLDSLIGPLPQAEPLYRDRSPLHRVDEIDVPVILFQGLEDHVVPPSQTEAMLEALRRRHVPSAYLAFDGEGHGFRMATTLVRVLETELWFLQRVMGIEPEKADVGLAVPGI